ncbi:putative leucine-rich repeat-containing, plant-type, leucine-rich repeat domain superfamily [Helianthus anomalus]
MAKSIHVFMLLVLHVLIFALANKVSSLSHDDECSLLLQFKENMSINNHSKVASWKSDGARRHCCLWDGVECSLGHVIGLDLSSSFLSGPISSNNSLFSLIHLHTLNLADNNFCYSKIPSGIGRLSQLAYLNLSYSAFSEEIPKQISQLRNLVSLDLTGNYGLKLQSSDFQNLVQNSSETLRELFLSWVDIDFELPASLVNSSLLTSLVMSNCGLRGEFPTCMFNMPTLQLLDVQGNSDLTGYIPEFHCNSELKHLIIAGTHFQGSISASIRNLTHLNILDLSSCAFTGTLPASVSNLTQLRELHLSYNGMIGQIPSSFSNLTQLTLLDLSHNEFAGSLPSSIGNQTQLRELHLGYNGMIGTIPSSFSNLTQLTLLDLSHNEFTGSLPSLERFENLTYLILSNNNFDRWKLPDWFGKLKKMTHLDLGYVNLYGEIPSSFFNLTQVESLYLSRNQLKGELPSSLLNLQNLEEFYLDGNGVTVDFHLFLSLEKLKYLDLYRNNVTLSVKDNHTNETQPQFTALWMESCNLKVFPEFLRFQQQLEYLFLINNKIEGLIPGWMWNISKETLSILSLSQNLLIGFEQHSPVASWVSLETLDLSHNMLTGEIPPSICDLLYLSLLDLSFNNITGSIPPCLEKIINSLVVLNLRSNTLQGTIPNVFTNESKIEMIDLSENNLEGRLPRSLENCESLQFLDLGHNFIEDTFPFWLGTLSKLQVLILRFNKLHGIIRIPSDINVNFPFLRIIDLSYNSFSGDLPHQYFQVWSAMKETEANATYMSMPRMWKDYWFSIQLTNKGVNMEYQKIIKTFYAVDLSSNMFRGKIPESIKTLTGLQLLNLSNNELSGVIPPSMGNLIRLESLDLSSNKLSRRIPQELVQLNFLEFLNVSNNKLIGPIPQGRQFNTFSNDSYMGNQALCGYPLSKKCVDAKVSEPSKVSFEEDTESDFPDGVDWVVILIGFVSGLMVALVWGDHVTRRYYKWFLQRFRK